MSKAGLYNNPIFHDEDAARAYLEKRLWPDGPICPKCGVIDQATLMKGKTTRPGLYQCNACREPFTVRMGTLYERSHVPLHKWLFATQLLMSAKNGISANEAGRVIGVSKKTAWFLMHRIRESLRQNAIDPPLGGQGKFVEADTTVIGGKGRHRKHHVPPKEQALALVERGGKVRSRHVPNVKTSTLRPILHSQIDRNSHLMSDEAAQFAYIGGDMAAHSAVNHSVEEYVRGDVHTNTVENYFSTLKRMIGGTYIHVSSQHLKRYLCEADYRYNERTALGVNDEQRFEKAIPGVVGKRLTYRRTRLDHLYAQEGEAPPQT
ncbi:MAG: IS1595 family transposase [Phycisphaerales bacterium]|nr:IS1595 family transposase [Hyphomonadaceae bacterium]